MALRCLWNQAGSLDPPLQGHPFPLPQAAPRALRAAADVVGAKQHHWQRLATTGLPPGALWYENPVRGMRCARVGGGGWTGMGVLRTPWRLDHSQKSDLKVRERLLPTLFLRTGLISLTMISLVWAEQSSFSWLQRGEEMAGERGRGQGREAGEVKGTPQEGCGHLSILSLFLVPRMMPGSWLVFNT